MNVPVIANQLVDAVRKISPAADIKVVEQPFEEQAMWFTIGADDALRLIDFIEEHTAVPAMHNPDQGRLFDPTKF